MGLGGGQTSGACARMCGSRSRRSSAPGPRAAAARSGPRRSGHRRVPVVVVRGGGHRVTSGVAARRGPARRAGVGVGGGRRGRPSRWCPGSGSCVSPARRFGGPVALVAVAGGGPGSRRGRLGEAAWTAACPSAQSTLARVVEQLGQVDRFGHLDPDPCGARRGGLGQPQPGAVAERRGTPPRRRCGRAVSGPARPAGAGGKWASSICGLPGVARACRATSTGPSSPTWTMTTCSSRPAGPAPTPSAPSRVCGTEYWPPSKETIGVFAGTVRVTPNATVCGVAGIGCSRARSSASISAGARRVTRCTRALTCSQNASHAASSSAKPSYSGSRLVSLGHQVGLGDLHRVLRPALGRRVGRHAGVMVTP